MLPLLVGWPEVGQCGVRQRTEEMILHTLFGSFTGAMFFAVISSALNILNVAAYWQYVVTGIFLISALGVQALRSYILVE